MATTATDSRSTLLQSMGRYSKPSCNRNRRGVPLVLKALLLTCISLAPTSWTPRITKPLRHHATQIILATYGKRCIQMGEQLLSIRSKRAHIVAKDHIIRNHAPETFLSKNPTPLYRYGYTLPDFRNRLRNPIRNCDDGLLLQTSTIIAHFEENRNSCPLHLLEPHTHTLRDTHLCAKQQ